MVFVSWELQLPFLTDCSPLSLGLVWVLSVSLVLPKSLVSYRELQIVALQGLRRLYLGLGFWNQESLILSLLNPAELRRKGLSTFLMAEPWGPTHNWYPKSLCASSCIGVAQEALVGIEHLFHLIVHTSWWVTLQ